MIHFATALKHQLIAHDSTMSTVEMSDAIHIRFAILLRAQRGQRRVSTDDWAMLGGDVLHHRVFRRQV